MSLRNNNNTQFPLGDNTQVPLGYVVDKSHLAHIINAQRKAEVDKAAVEDARKAARKEDKKATKKATKPKHKDPITIAKAEVVRCQQSHQACLQKEGNGTAKADAEADLLLALQALAAAEESAKAQKEADQVIKKAQKEAQKEADQVAKKVQKEAEKVAKKDALTMAASDEGRRVLDDAEWVHSQREWLASMKVQHNLSFNQVKVLYTALQQCIAKVVLEDFLEPTPAKPTPAVGLNHFHTVSKEEFLTKNKEAWRGRKSLPVASAKEPDVKNVAPGAPAVAPEAPAVAPGAKLTFAQRQLLTRAFYCLSHHEPLERSESTTTIFKSLSPRQMGPPAKPAQGAKCRELTEQYERLFNKNPTCRSATNEPSATAPPGYNMETWQEVHTPSRVGTPKTPNSSAGSPDSPAADSPAADSPEIGNSTAENTKRVRIFSPDPSVWGLANESKDSTPEGEVETLV